MFRQKFPNYSKDFSHPHQLYSNKKKAIYCFVPKVACTNWKWIIYQLENGYTSNGVITRAQIHNNLPFNRVWNDETYEKIKQYYTYLFVRHPFERLVSAYRNKLFKPYRDDHYLLNTLGKYIIKKYRKNSTVNTGTCTFAEFVEFLIDKASKHGSKSFNEHWKPYSKLCDICHTRYDFIGKHETLVEDSRLILKKLKVDSRLIFPENGTDDYKTRSSEIYEEYMRTIPKEKILKLYNIYEDDFDAFSYKLHQFV